MTADLDPETFAMMQRKIAELNKVNEEMVKLSTNEHECFRQIFEAIGTTNRFFVEIGYDGHFDREQIPLWTGVYIDKNPPEETAFVHKVKCIKEFVTAENINEILRIPLFEVPEQIDLFAIDIDGNDFHILRALNAVVPRVIIAEYNASFGPEKSVTIKYNPNFNRERPAVYHGASLAAFTKLLNARGYALVATDYYGLNAFFVKSEICYGKLRELTAAEAWRPHLLRGGSWEEQFNEMKDLEFEIV